MLDRRSICSPECSPIRDRGPSLVARFHRKRCRGVGRLEQERDPIIERIMVRRRRKKNREGFVGGVGMKLTGITQRNYRRTRWDATRHGCGFWIRYLKGAPRLNGAKSCSGSLSPGPPTVMKFSGNHDDGANGRTGA